MTNEQNAFKSLSSEDKLKYYKTYFENMGEGSDVYMLKHGDNMFLSKAGTLSEGTRNDFNYGNTPGKIDTFTEAMTAWGPATTGTCYMGVCNGLPGAAHITNETGMTTKAQKGNWAGYYDRSGAYGNDQTFDEQFFNPLNTDVDKSGGTYNTYTKEADRIKVLSTPMDYPTPMNPYFLEGTDSSKWDDHWNKALGGSIPKAQEGTGFLDFLTNPIRKRLAENLYPVHYSGPAPHLTDFDFWEGNQSPEQKVLEALKGNKENYLLQQNQDRRKYADQTLYDHALIERTDLLHLLMGQDQKHNSMNVSEYRPTKAKDKNITYYKSKVTEDYLRDLLNNVGYDNIHAKGDKDYGERYNNQNTSSSLSTFQIDKGEDEKGKYISYYDIWDLDPFKKETFMSKVADKGQSLLGVTPPEIYGRIYIDDDKSVEPQSKVTIGGIKLKEKKHGGSLPKAQDGWFDKVKDGVNSVFNPYGPLLNYGVNKVKENVANNWNAGKGYVGEDSGFATVPNVLERIWNTGFKNESELAGKNIDGEGALEQNMFRMYLGQPQKEGDFQFQKSQYVPTKGNEEGDEYWSIPEEYRNSIYGHKSFPQEINLGGWHPDDGDVMDYLKQKYSGVVEGDMVVGDYTRGVGRDEDNNIYLSPFIFGETTAKLSMFLIASASISKNFSDKTVSMSKYNTSLVFEFLIPQLIPAPLPKLIFLITFILRF